MMEGKGIQTEKFHYFPKIIQKKFVQLDKFYFIYIDFSNFYTINDR